MFLVKILTLFPEIFPGPLNCSVIGRAMNKGLWKLEAYNIRNYAKLNTKLNTVHDIKHNFLNNTKIENLIEKEGTNREEGTKKIKDFNNKRVDDAPYGGGSGLVIRPDILGNAIEHVFLNKIIPIKNSHCNDSGQNNRGENNDYNILSESEQRSILNINLQQQLIEKHNSQFNTPIIYLTPRGTPFTQAIARKLSKKPAINIICGRFEGIDERVINEYKIQTLSIGDYVVSSGDIAALVLIDACVRLIPGVLKSKQSLNEESFGSNFDSNSNDIIINDKLNIKNIDIEHIQKNIQDKDANTNDSFDALNNNSEYLLEYHHYTRPRLWKNHSVPEVLLSGNHAEIAKWRLEVAKEITKKNRPDLWQKYLIAKLML